MLTSDSVTATAPSARGKSMDMPAPTESTPNSRRLSRYFFSSSSKCSSHMLSFSLLVLLPSLFVASACRHLGPTNDQDCSHLLSAAITAVAERVKCDREDVVIFECFHGDVLGSELRSRRGFNSPHHGLSFA